MKQITCLLMAALLLLLCCACATSPVTDVPVGDGYVPVAGLSFGMSVEDAKKVYPNLKESYPDDVITPAEGTTLEEIRAGYPYFDDQLLENAEVYGQKATVRLRFATLRDSPNFGEKCWHNYGLLYVFVTFDKPVDVDAIMGHMDEMYDGDNQYTQGIESKDYTRLSKSKISNLDTETLETLRDYMSNFPITRESDGEQITVDRSMLIDQALDDDVWVPENRRYLVSTLFRIERKTIKFTGWIAAYLYAARATENDLHPSEYEEYTDDILGFRLRLPAKWKDRYSIEPNIGDRKIIADERDSVVLKMTNATWGGILCCLFRYSMDKWIELDYGDALPSGYIIMAATEENIYVMTFTGDVQYDLENENEVREYTEMKEELFYWMRYPAQNFSVIRE